MPVKFKGDSEYHEHFKWMNSPKSATFTPTKQQAAPTAGLSSPQTSLTRGFQNEPAILRKKKPIPLVTTSTTKMFDEDIVVPDDYMLLGGQEKFTPNVPYRDYLTKNRQRVLGTTYVQQPEISSPPDNRQAQPSKPLPKVNFDTGAPRKSVAVQDNVQVNGTQKPINMSKTRVIAKEPVGPVSPPQMAGEAKERREQPQRKRTTSVDDATKLEAQKSVGEPQKTENLVRIGQKQDKSIDDTYAMKYRAGLAPKRQSNKRKSEYTYKFDWKKPVESTPVLAAEQLIHNNNPQVGPYKDKMPNKSEYQKEFKQWKYRPVIGGDNTEGSQLRKNVRSSGPRRSKSETRITPDRRPAAGSPSRATHDNQRLTRSLNPQKPFFPLRRTVSWTSEYRSNYQPFSNYKYDKGAWKGAAPPHVKQQAVIEAAPVQQSGTWVREVRELREKADEYRKRSLGTHFSRSHVAQLLSENSKLWDAVSVSSELSALDLEQSEAMSSTAEKEKRPSPKRGRTLSAQANLQSGTSKKKVNESVQTEPVTASGARKRLAWSSDGGRSTSTSDSVRSIRSSSSATLQSRDLDNDLCQPMQDVQSEESESTENGRAQTPEIVELPIARRHHLDVTTPNRHGLMLASPPHRQELTKSHQKSSAARKGKSRIAPSQTITVDVTPTCGDNSVANQIQLSPTYGKPTPDTHPLLNEDVMEPVDVILETRYVQSPQPTGKNLPTLAEGIGMTYNVPPPQQGSWQDIIGNRQKEDDELSELSTSVMSAISSSSSLASETLQRAAKRQREFWGKTA